MIPLKKYQHSIWKIEVTYDTVNLVGTVSASDVISSILPGKTVLATLMLSNNESEPLQPETKVSTSYQE